MYCEISCFPDEQLPPSPTLVAIHLNDPDHGSTADEIQDRYEFIRCYLVEGLQALMMIPKQERDYDFFIPDVDVSHEEYSAFNTHDYQRTQRPFDNYGYAMQKILERAKDLAILHSCISNPEGRQAISRRYEALVDCEFRYRLLALVDRYRTVTDEDKRFSIRGKVAELNRRIMACKTIWVHHAPPAR